MAGLRDVLDRFRPIGAPGAATAAGVPVDRRAGVEAELEPVFEALAPTTARARRITSRAESWADDIVAEANKRAAEALADARMRAPALRADAASRTTALAAADAETIAADAAVRSAQVAAEAAATRQSLIEMVIDRLRSDIAGLDQSVSDGQ
jgi:hypothetical protein